MLTAASALVLHRAQCFNWGVGGMGCTRDGVVVLHLQASAKEGDRPAWSAALGRLGAGHAAKGAATATARGFEPLRAEPNGFLVHHLSHSVTLSWTQTGVA